MRCSSAGVVSGTSNATSTTQPSPPPPLPCPSGALLHGEAGAPGRREVHDPCCCCCGGGAGARCEVGRARVGGRTEGSGWQCGGRGSVSWYTLILGSVEEGGGDAHGGRGDAGALRRACTGAGMGRRQGSGGWAKAPPPCARERRWATQARRVTGAGAGSRAVGSAGPALKGGPRSLAVLGEPTRPRLRLSPGSPQQQATGERQTSGARPGKRQDAEGCFRSHQGLREGCSAPVPSAWGDAPTGGEAGPVP